MNSQHQLWSLWSWTVTPQRQQHSYAEVKINCARFALKCFGTATQMLVQQRNGRWVIKVRTEGHPVHDPQYVNYVCGLWKRFFFTGFGHSSIVEFGARLEAGDAQNGRPRDQLVIMPSLAIGVEHES